MHCYLSSKKCGAGLFGLLLVAGLTACGGGSSGGGGGASTTSVGGVAASGAPITDGTVTLICGDGTSLPPVATDATTGAYSVTLPATCLPPYVLSVTGTIGDAPATMLALLATSVATGTAAVANITPLTHAMAGSVASSGDPMDLVTNFTTEKANITATSVNSARATLVAAITNTITQAGGDPTTFDPVSTSFNANRAGLDKMLDNLQIQVIPGGGVTISSTGAVAMVDDMASNASATADALGSSAFKSATVTISKTDTASTVTKVPVAATGVTMQDNSIGDQIKGFFNACFAQNAATRGSIAANTVSTVCANLPISSTYLHDGHSSTVEFDKYLTSSKYDNAKFAPPQIIRFFSDTASDRRALVKFGLTRADGQIEAMTTVVESSTANTGGRVQLRGNQRAFKVFTNGVAQKRIQVATKGTTVASTFYQTAINFNFGFADGGAGGTAGTGTTGRKVSNVRVKGPALPAAGVWLNPRLAGCDSYYAIASGFDVTPVRCTSLFTLSSRAANTTDTDNFSAFYAGSRADFNPTGKVTDANLLNIQPNSAYTYEIWRQGTASTSPPDLVWIDRLRSRPPTMGTVAAKDGEIDKVRWNTLAQSTIDAITPASASAFTGGASFTVSWTNTANNPSATNLQVQLNPTGSSLFQDSTSVSPSATTVALTNGGVAWPSVKTTTTSGSTFAQLSYRNQYDTQIFSSWAY